MNDGKNLLKNYRALRAFYDDDVSTSDQLLDQLLENLTWYLIEIFNDILGNTLNKLFVRGKSTINLHSKSELLIPSVNYALKVKSHLNILVP